MDGNSLDIIQTSLQKLKELFPEVFTEDKLDWEKLRAAFGEDINFANERYVLNWAGKSDAFKVLQQPTTATLKPVIEESVNFDTTENIFIEGENLEVLKVLQKAYYGKIKCVIIDPPYNTGGDSFIYPDRFSEKKEDYLKRIGDKDEEGYLMKEGLFRKNSKDSGHFHSNWLSMMYPRLFLAKNLLRDDGIIFVHIDDNEVHNLRLVMNEIFGEENFLCQFIWKSRQNKDNRNTTGASIDHEYILCYGRKIKGSQRKTEQYANPDNDPRGPWVNGNMVGLATEDDRPNLHYDLINPETGINYGKPKLGWRYDRETMNRLIQEKRILWPESSAGRPRKKTFLNELQSEFAGFSSVIGNHIYTRNGTVEIEALFGLRIFDFPKPSSLLKELIIQGTDDGDIVLDFFSGSAPTAHAVLELNKEDGGARRFILVQMPEPCDENSEAYKAGYKTIADIAKERIRRVIRKIQGKPIDGHSRETYPRESLSGNGNPEGLFKDTALDSRLQTAGMTDEHSNDSKIDPGFKVFKLSPSNFKMWRGSEIDNG